jgi:predicted porin
MNKKLLVLAVAGAFVAPAAMAQSNVTIGGRMNFSLDSLKGRNAAGTDLTTKTNVSTNSSNIYFKGTEDLGNGLSAFWQIQTFFSAGGTGNADTGPGAGAAAAGQATKDGVSSGNTYVGLEGKSWGKVLLGKHDTPFKLLSRKVDLFSDQLGDSRNLVHLANGGGAMGLLSAGWDLRPGNVIAYITPNFSGFSAAIGYVTNVGSGAAVDSPSAATSATIEAVDAWSAKAVYENGPIFVGLGYERHNLSKLSSDPVVNNADEKAWRLAAGYNFGDFKVVGLYQRESGLCVVATAGTVLCGNTDAQRTTWGLGGAYKMGANTIKLQYYKAGDIKHTNIANADQTGANLWALGVDHALSKRTTVYAVYARTNNERWAAYSAFGGGHGDNPGTVTPTATRDSKDPSGFSLGVIHHF